MAINPWLQAIRPVAPALRSGRVPNVRQFPIPSNMLLRRFGSAVESNPTYEEEIPPEEELPLPPIPPEPETVAPAITTNAGGATRSQGQDGESPEMLNALREFQANLRAQHMMTQPQQSQLSVLDMLRKRMAREAEGEELRNLTDIGIGMLRSSSPNFFTMLAGGLQAQREGQRSRIDQLRQLAELERQDAAQRAEEAYRREQNRLQAERLAAEAPLRSAQAEQALAYRDYLRAGGSGAGRSASLSAANLRRVEQAASSALNNARLAASRESPPRTLTPAEENRIYREAEQRAIQTLRLQPQTSETPSPTPQPDIPTITPGGRPAR